MGFFSQVKNFITGGGAKVSVSVEQPRLSEPFGVEVQALAESQLDIRRVWVEVRSREFIDARVRVREHDADDGPSHDYQRVREEETLLEQTFDLAGPQTLPEGETVSWSGQVTLPAGAQPNFRGHHAKHIWQIRAGLDVTGNDPDSGWIDLDPEA